MSRLTKYEPREYSMFPYQLKDDELSTKLDSIHKLGQLEDLEDELGCSILDVFKALKEGIKINFEGQLIPPKLYYDDVYNQWKFKINYYSTAVGLYNVKDVINGMEEEE